MYRSIWNPMKGEVLLCARETGNRHDPFSVKVIKSAMIVGHLHKRIRHEVARGVTKNFRQ